MAHDHQDLPHYHLGVFYRHANGANTCFEIPSPLFRDDCLERDVYAATVADVRDYVRDRCFGDDPDPVFYITWRGLVLNANTMRLADIEVEGQRIRLYIPDREYGTVIVHRGSPPDDKVSA